MNKKCVTKPAEKLLALTVSFCLWFPAYFCEQIVKSCEGSKVSFRYDVGSMFFCSRWVVLTGMNSALQRKHPWEDRVGTNVHDDRQEISFNFSVKCLQGICLLCFFGSCLEHLHTPKLNRLPTLGRGWHQPDTGMPSGSVPAGQDGTWDSSAGLPGCQPSRSAPCPSYPPLLAGSVRDRPPRLGAGTAQKLWRHLGPSKLKSSCLEY